VFTDFSIVVLYVPNQPETKVFRNGFTVFFLKYMTDVVEEIFGASQQSFMLFLVMSVFRKPDFEHHLFLVSEMPPGAGHKPVKGMAKPRRVRAVVQRVDKVPVIGDQFPVFLIKGGDAGRQVLAPLEIHIRHDPAAFIDVSSRWSRTCSLERPKAHRSPRKRRATWWQQGPSAHAATSARLAGATTL
jgi:hypothetical protein